MLKRTLAPRLKATILNVPAITIVCTLAACGGGSGGVAGSSASAAGAAAGASGSYIPAGNAATVEGTDSAHRGYRDDVEQLIADNYSSIPEVKASAEQAARDYQQSITALTLAMSDTSSVVLAQAQLA